MTTALEQLAAVLHAEGGLVAGCIKQPADAREPGLAGIAAAGPRAAADPRGYELVIEAIREGYLLHFAGGGRVIDCDDPDLALLAGDLLYALGLERLVALGDLEAVAELADVISLSALAHSRSDDDLAEAVWEAGARAVGWGSDPDHSAAKALVRTADPGAAALLQGFAKAPADIVPDPPDRGYGPQENQCQTSETPVPGTRPTT